MVKHNFKTHADLPPQRPGSRFPITFHPEGTTPESMVPKSRLMAAYAMTTAIVCGGAAVSMFLTKDAVALGIGLAGGAVTGAFTKQLAKDYGVPPTQQTFYIDGDQMVMADLQRGYIKRAFDMYSVRMTEMEIGSGLFLSRKAILIDDDKVDPHPLLPDLSPSRLSAARTIIEKEIIYWKIVNARGDAPNLKA